MQKESPVPLRRAYQEHHMSAIIDKNSAIPLYVQIEDFIRHTIAIGEWKPGERIPSEAALNERLGVSRMTVRGVLNGLVDDGLLYRVPGKGTFVTEEKISALSPAYKGVREQLEQMGFATATELIRFKKIVPNKQVRAKLGLDATAPVFEILRRRLVDDAPVSLHRSFVPVALAPHLDDANVVDEQLCVILERDYELHAAHTFEQLEAVAATESEANSLDLKPGAPLLLLEDTLSDRSKNVFEYSRILFRGDRMKLHFNYES
jgi:GntR family transcriptional regulator